MPTESHPAVSEHAEDMWAQRTDSPLDIDEAWDVADRVFTRTGIDADEVRYHPPTDTVILRKGTALVTAIRVEDSSKPRLQAGIARHRKKVGEGPA